MLQFKLWNVLVGVAWTVVGCALLRSAVLLPRNLPDGPAYDHVRNLAVLVPAVCGFAAIGCGAGTLFRRPFCGSLFGLFTFFWVFLVLAANSGVVAMAAGPVALGFFICAWIALGPPDSGLPS